MKRNYFLVLIMLFLVTSVTFAQLTVKFQKPASWTAVSLYSWGPETLGGWPGTALTSTNGWYTYTFPLTFTGGNLIFNNAGAGEQTVSYPITTSVCLQSSATLNSGGQYDLTTVACTTGGITVRVNKPTAWTSIYIYAYVNSAPIIGAWPGVQLTLDATGWYSYTFDASVTAVNIIYNNNLNAQATDTYITASACYSTNGATLTSVSCTTGMNDVKEKVLTIYPNPIVDKINFAGLENIERVTIHSLTGGEVMSVTQIGDNGSVDVRSLISGVYFVSVDYSGGKQLTEKIIKL